MSILKSAPQFVAICKHGLQQTETVAKRQISSKKNATFCHKNWNNSKILVHTRTLKSSHYKQRSSGYLSDPGNIGKRQSGVNFDTLGSWNNRLGLDVNLEESIASGKLIPKICTDDAASATVLGRRKQNEDRVSIEEISPELLLFAIYDGHGGSVRVFA